jgi:hypothetical protein
MKVTIEITATFHCNVERAFKAPMLGDATRFLNGYLFQPPVQGFEEDETWGQTDGIRYPVTRGNAFLPPGRIFTDKILERKENQYWKWMIYDFQPSMLFFAEKAIGEWHVCEKQDHTVDVRYLYTFYAAHVWTQIFNWLFAQIQWKGMMNKAMKGIRMQAESDEQFVYK